MNKTTPSVRFCIALIFGMVLIVHFTALPVEAAEAASWRPTYDLIMRWINFGILVFFIVKYGKDPLMSFIKGQQTEVAKKIDQVESRKTTLLDEIQEASKKIEKSSQWLETIKRQIILEGEREKQKIIDNAREFSKTLLDAEKKKVGTRIRSARNQFMAELVDAAMAAAQQKLPGLMTDSDHQKMLNLYLSGIHRMAE